MTLSYQRTVFGPTWLFPFTNTARLIRLAAPDVNGLVKRVRFEIRVTQTMRARHGSKDVIAAAVPDTAVLNTAPTAGARYVKTSERWVVDVFDTSTNYLSIVRGDSTNGNMEISRMDALETSDPPLWVA